MDIEAISQPQDAAGAAAVAAAPAPQPAAAAPAGAQAPDNTTLADTLGTFLGSSSGSNAGVPTPSTSVSYRVEKPDEIVTVISDHSTGREIAQFPTQTMIEIAQFFATEQGVTFDRNA